MSISISISRRQRRARGMCCVQGQPCVCAWHSWWTTSLPLLPSPAAGWAASSGLRRRPSAPAAMCWSHQTAPDASWWVGGRVLCAGFWCPYLIGGTWESPHAACTCGVAHLPPPAVGLRPAAADLQAARGSGGCHHPLELSVLDDHPQSVARTGGGLHGAWGRTGGQASSAAAGAAGAAGALSAQN